MKRPDIGLNLAGLFWLLYTLALTVAAIALVHRIFH